MTPTRTPSQEKIREDFDAVVAETEQLLKAVVELGGEQAGVARGNLNEALAAARERLAEIRERSIAQATHAAKAADEYVKADPWRAVGVVAVAGVVAGLALGVVLSRR